MVFYLNVEERKRILGLKSRKKEFKKSIAGFSKHIYMSICGKPLQFLYRNLNKLEKMAK